VATGGGVVLGVEKRVTSTLLETSSVEKIVEIDRHIGCAMSGLQADARSMIEHARVESQNHSFNYNEPLRVESCTQAICDLALRFGEGADGEESIMSRPFGVALLIAGYDEDGPQLYHAEPSGTFYRYDAKAIGSGSEGAQAELQNEFHKVRNVPYTLPSLLVADLIYSTTAPTITIHTDSAPLSPSPSKKPRPSS
jgi:20S proteasome subunit alpha 5